MDLSSHARARPEQQLALARVARQRRRPLELGAGLGQAAELGEQVAAHARQQVVALRAPAPRSARRPASSPAAARTPSPPRPPGSARPPATAPAGPARRTAPRSAPSRSPRRSAPGRGRRRSPPAARTGRGAPPSRSARSSAASPRRISSWSQRRAVLVEQQDRLARRADRGPASRDAWISISATRPCTSGSSGASPARTRPSRSASSHSAGRIQSSPAVAE